MPQQGEQEKKQDDDNIVHAKIPSIHFDSATVFYNVVGRQRDCGWIISFHDLVVARLMRSYPLYLKQFASLMMGVLLLGWFRI